MVNDTKRRAYLLNLSLVRRKRRIGGKNKIAIINEQSPKAKKANHFAKTLYPYRILFVIGGRSGGSIHFLAKNELPEKILWGNIIGD
jgi:hypothetical protein